MAIQPLDMKILWAKAAGRCSMQQCRKRLVADASQAVPSKNILIGENCHIVADKNNGPRGKSNLPKKDRDRYPNLILLCRNHHGVVDKDPAAWPIEKLHQVKADHELWVETQLAQSEQTIEDQLYSMLVNAATEGLQLARWEAISDHAIRGLLLNSFVEGAGSFGTKVFKTVWPKKKPELEAAIRNLAERVDAYIKYFMTRARLRSDAWWVEDKTWKRKWRDDYDELTADARAWQQKTANLLANIVVALNEYASSVRSQLKPDYFLLQGNFTLYDSMGVTNNLHEVHYMPSKYIDV